MERIVIPYTTEKEWLENRKKDLTSSDIPCLFGYGYISEDELREHKKNGTSLEYKPDERKQWGLALQDAIAHEFARQNNWDIRKMTEYIRIPELRLGSSFDFEINGEAEDSKGEAYSTKELLELKNVDGFQYKKEWVTDGFEIEATPYIELQVQHQLLISGFDFCYIGALVGGNKGVLLRREANKKVQEAILKKAEKFWKEVGND